VDVETQGSQITSLTLALLALACALPCSCSSAVETGDDRGLVRHEEGAEEGYVLFDPLLSTLTYLIDTRGHVVHTWRSTRSPCMSYLLENGQLLRSVQPLGPAAHDTPGAATSYVEKVDWGGKVVWRFALAHHHDLEPLPNGNVLIISSQRKTREEALAAGRYPSRVGADGLWPDCILEIEPLGTDDGRVVWRWCMWDHLIQDVDADRRGFGVISEHPELIDVNGDLYPRTWTAAELERLSELGYIGGSATPLSVEPDFMHTNSVAYNAELDQVMVSVPRFNEVWVIDHSTTTVQASGHAGGRRGRGGDLLYRWGNPVTYGRGALAQRRLFEQHDARWIAENLPGAGNITMFNNGLPDSVQPYSSVLEIEPPLASDGTYIIKEDAAFDPPGPIWKYVASPRRKLFADFLSGAHRLPNGNTLVTDGPRGRFLQVTRDGEIAWVYENPFSGRGPNPAGDPPHAVFKATFLARDHPALRGRDLEPLDPQPPRLTP
jgi:hypothetical protein